MGTRLKPGRAELRAPTAEQVLAVVDRAYDVEAADDAWTAGLAETFRPLVDSGEGVHAFRFDLRANVLSSATLAGGEASWRDEWREVWWEGFMRRLPPGALRAMAEFGPVAHTTDLWAAAASAIPSFEELLVHGGRRALPAAGAATAGMRYPDSLNVAAIDTDGVGVAFCANRTAVSESVVPERARWLLGRLAGHVASAARLRSRLRHAPLLDSADAVLDGRGKVLHAPGVAPVALEALRRAAVDVSSVRERRGAAQADGVLDLWRALYAGEYSVLDTFDRDGRRFVVARSNAPRGRGSVPVLTDRQRQILALVACGCSNKLVAYELGVSTSVVGAQVARLKTLLGARTSSELVQLARRAMDGDA